MQVFVTFDKRSRISASRYVVGRIGQNRTKLGPTPMTRLAIRSRRMVTAMKLAAARRHKSGSHRVKRRRRSALVMTDTELKLIAAAAIMGLSNRPKIGYSTPAAIGTPSAL